MLLFCTAFFILVLTTFVDFMCRILTMLRTLTLSLAMIFLRTEISRAVELHSCQPPVHKPLSGLSNSPNHHHITKSHRAFTQCNILNPHCYGLNHRCFGALQVWDFGLYPPFSMYTSFCIINLWLGTSRIVKRTELKPQYMGLQKSKNWKK